MDHLRRYFREEEEHLQFDYPQDTFYLLNIRFRSPSERGSHIFTKDHLVVYIPWIAMEDLLEDIYSCKTLFSSSILRTQDILFIKDPSKSPFGRFLVSQNTFWRSSIHGVPQKTFQRSSIPLEIVFPQDTLLEILYPLKTSGDFISGCFLYKEVLHGIV